MARQTRGGKARRGSQRPPDSAGARQPGGRDAAAMTRRPTATAETILRHAVYAAIGLVLLTPLVITPDTIYPFVVGKAVWSRSIIGVAFALWVILALLWPGYGPPRSRLLMLLGAGLAVALIAALTGESLQRSLWSDYQRMQGVIDDAHWVAFAVVVASMLRSPAAWRVVLGTCCAVGAAVAGIVLARRYGLDLPFYGALPELHLPRMSGPLGNPTYLGVYMLTNLFVALGLAARIWRAAASAHRTNRLRALPWLAAGGLHFLALVVAGSVGSFAGLAAAVGFLALFGAVIARGGVRLLAVMTLVAMVLAAAFAGARFTAEDRAAQWLPEGPFARVLATHIDRPSVQSRLAAWKAGLEGFADRPVLGWGPENFITVFGRYASGYGAFSASSDEAHNKFVEVAATTGAAGVAAWLALWGLAFATVWRAAARTTGGEQAVALGAGAALTGLFVSGLYLFDTASGSLLTVVLLAFAASLERTAFPGWRGPRPPGWLAALLAPGQVHRALAAATMTVALAAATTGLVTHQRILGAASDKALGEVDHEVIAEAIDAFGPLANTWRQVLFDAITEGWPRILAEDSAEAIVVLEWAADEGEAALRATPGDWRIHRSLAHMFRAVAETDPAYADEAERFLTSTRALTPARAVFPVDPEPPSALSLHRRADGRAELRWRWPQESVGYIVITETRGPDGPLRYILHAYDPAQTSLVLPEGRAPGPWHYHIKACRNQAQCSPVAEWPDDTNDGGE